MITDLANLGPSLKRTTDLGANKGKDKAFANPNGRPEASSFDQILKTTADKSDSSPVSPKSEKSDKVVREQQLRKDPVPVQKRMNDQTPEKPESANVASNKNEPRTAQKKNENWEEPGSVQEKGQGEKVGTKSNKESQNREQVMLEFMDSMESEFGIPPQRIVEAMTNIPDSEQLTSPEDSASQVIAQLELPDDQAQKALALYMGMLAQLQMAQDPTPKAAMVAAGAAGAAVAAPSLMTSQQRRASLNQSLDQMNSKFFMQGPSALKPESQALKSMSPNGLGMPETKGMMESFPKDQVSFGARAQTEKLPAFMQRPEMIPTPDSELANLQQQMQSVDPNSKEAQALLKSLAALSASAAALDQGMKADPKNMQALKAEQILTDPNAGAAAPVAGMSGLAALGLGGEDEDDMDDFGGDRSSPDQQFMVSQSAGHHSSARTAGAVGSETQFGAMMAAGEGRGVGANEKQANIQQLMNQAQYLIKKGGGEAKIQMAPEGIGQVHMKMTVLDGKVNLEMQAETKEAKKLIETSLGDLKTHLAHHQLSMDQVKVDVGNQTSSETRQDQNQQRQMDARQDQGKDQARQFWSEFNGGGGFERRSAFNESSGIKAYNGTRREAPLTPANAGTTSARRETGSGKGRGLDLVA